MTSASPSASCRPGPLNAITDVDGVAVGMTTLIEGDGPLVVGRGPVRTGVTVIVPHPGIGAEPVFAGCHRSTATASSPVSNGSGSRASSRRRSRSRTPTASAWCATRSSPPRSEAAPMPPRTGACRSSGETYDGALNDINGFHVRAEHLFAALDSAATGQVAEGGRRRRHGHDLPRVQGRHRHRVAPGRRVDGRRPGAGELRTPRAAHGRRRARRARDPARRTCPHRGTRRSVSAAGAEPGAGSIIVILATDAPMLPHQLRAPRPARRPRHRSGRRGGRALERRHLPGVLDRQPSGARGATRSRRQALPSM